MKLSGKMADMQMSSQSLKKAVPIIRYLPPNYNQQSSYPVLIVLDGRDYLQIGRLASLVDEWVTKQLIRPVIIAALPYENISSRWQQYHPDGAGFIDFQRMLGTELLPFLAAQLAIRREPEAHTMIGDSLAGICSLLTALAYPMVFGKVVMQSPFVNQTVIDQVAAAGSAAQSLTIFHSIGRKETTVKTTRGTIENFLDPNRRLSQLLSHLQPENYTYMENGGAHLWRSWQRAIPSLLLDQYSIR
ncbi:MAG: alpha/beta hydrolase-fold protein [Sporolactobacillus sp.]